MHFKVFKNTVLFPIIILPVLVMISCSNIMKSEDGGQHDDELSSSEMLNHTSTTPSTGIQYNDEIIVGANQTEAYLPLLKDKRVGVVANQTSVIFKEEIHLKLEAPKDLSGQYEALETIYFEKEHIIDSLLKHQINITKVFSPEHGFRGKADAGENVKDGIDTKTNLPIYSLHGKHKKPTDTQLEELDIIVFDIQDVGVRFYTYISTLHYVMEACAENNIPLLILDRPNPNGNYVDGPTLKEAHRSFLGMHPIPLVHGMTIGEYAKMINGEGWLANNVKCEITVIPVKNYTHNSAYSLPIRPSPNLPNDQSITLYPSLGLFEGTNINAGRGTEFQFQRYGAPFLNPDQYNFSYTPVPNFGAKYPKHKNELCYGADLSIITVERKFTLKYIMDAYNNALDKSKVFNTTNFTKHAGTELLQQQIEGGLSEEEIRLSWKEELQTYHEKRLKYLLYD